MHIAKVSDPEKRLFGRTRRIMKVSSSVAGLGVNILRQRYSNKDLHQAAQKTVQVIGGLKGPLMKIFQILSTIPDVLPKEYSEALRKLQADAPPMGWPFVQRRMRGELGDDWLDKLPNFTRQAVHAASLGQVHRARLIDKYDVACKLQYPDMSSIVDADLKQLKILLGIYIRINPVIFPENVYIELVERLNEELDYKRELKHIKLYQQMLAEEKCTTIPEPVPELSTSRLLVMQWLSGRSLMDVEREPLVVRNQLAKSMFRTWYVPFYRYGIIHGDPHPGNYSARDDNGINLLDFGCVRIFPPKFVYGVMQLYEALRDKNRDQAAFAYNLWGFQELDNKLLDVLNIWANFLYAPLLEDKVQKIQQSNSGQYGADIASKVYLQLKKLGAVTPPREFLLMDRAAIGLGGLFLRLRAEINWYREFHSLIEGFDQDTLAQNQLHILEKNHLI